MKGYKTVVFNLIMGVVMFVNQVLGTELDANELLTNLNGLEEAITGIWLTGNVWLRAVTDSPIFKKP